VRQSGHALSFRRCPEQLLALAFLLLIPTAGMTQERSVNVLDALGQYSTSTSDKPKDGSAPVDTLLKEGDSLTKAVSDCDFETTELPSLALRMLGQALLEVADTSRIAGDGLRAIAACQQIVRLSEAYPDSETLAISIIGARRRLAKNWAEPSIRLLDCVEPSKRPAIPTAIKSPRC